MVQRLGDNRRKGAGEAAGALALCAACPVAVEYALCRLGLLSEGNGPQISDALWVLTLTALTLGAGFLMSFVYLLAIVYDAMGMRRFVVALSVVTTGYLFLGVAIQSAARGPDVVGIILLMTAFAAIPPIIVCCRWTRFAADLETDPFTRPRGALLVSAVNWYVVTIEGRRGANRAGLRDDATD